MNIFEFSLTNGKDRELQSEFIYERKTKQLTKKCHRF